MDVTVEDDPAGHRFVWRLDGDVAGMAGYRVRDGVTVITHSEIDREFRGRGLGGEATRLTLDQLRAQGARVIPSCPFFGKYIAEHPEYADLVAD